VIASLELLDRLKGSKMFYTPVLFIPLDDALLKNEARADLRHTSELQWEFILTCWKHNVDVWLDMKTKMMSRLAIFMLYWVFVRWKWGGKATLPMMKLAGLPVSSLHLKYGKKCEDALCPEKTEKPKNALMEIGAETDGMDFNEDKSANGEKGATDGRSPNGIKANGED
jgi:hypothetical protein